MALPRKLTAAEKTTFLASFPLLDVDFTIVTDEPSGVYNCISWTVGVTNLWHWPGGTLANFDSFYSQFGLQRKTKGHVAAWGFADNNMTHGCISGPTHGPCWESKCGSLARIQHCLNELNGPAYGHVIAYYTWKIKIVPLPIYLKKYMKLKKEFTKEEINRLKALIKEIPREKTVDFEKRFSAWKRIWHTGSQASSSDPYTRTKTAEFRELKALGKSIVPLLASKLMDETNFLALPAFEELVDKKMIIHINPKDEKVLEGEQGRTFRTVKNYLASL
ncbi:MAG TPA: hypothetical protein VK483_03645 [Chitinophagaceae bacterium]|nr:hypothetical protein [Chitinophagaceae bacterium]